MCVTLVINGQYNKVKNLHMCPSTVLTLDCGPKGTRPLDQLCGHHERKPLTSNFT